MMRIVRVWPKSMDLEMSPRILDPHVSTTSLLNLANIGQRGRDMGTKSCHLNSD